MVTSISVKDNCARFIRYDFLGKGKILEFHWCFISKKEKITKAWNSFKNYCGLANLRQHVIIPIRFSSQGPFHDHALFIPVPIAGFHVKSLFSEKKKTDPFEVLFSSDARPSSSNILLSTSFTSDVECSMNVNLFSLFLLWILFLELF